MWVIALEVDPPPADKTVTQDVIKMNRQLDLNSYQANKPPACKRCGSSAVVKDGRYRRVSKQAHVYCCKRCSCRFVLATSDLERMRHKSSVIAFACQLYSEAGVSYRTVARVLQQHFSVQVSYETVRLWIARAAEHVYLPKYSDINIDTWAADETVLWVNGHKRVLWLVFDPKHKLVLAWHIGWFRILKDAVAVLRKALKATGCRPKQLLTDHLPTYRKAMNKVLGYRFTKHTPRGLGGNNHIERFFREVKRRVKWFSSFRSNKGLESWLKTFIYCYHYIKPHRTLGWQTPASLT